jgi:hypothetical protein
VGDMSVAAEDVQGRRQFQAHLIEG